ncbi:hypothetical protein GCM10027258_57630 [Amycolatopsis stemonae]
MEFTEKSLPIAVRWLFETNGYEVSGPIEIHGAEVDLVATQLSGFTEQKVYIEATIQYVDNTKYGKDLTKLTMFRNEPGAQRIIVSSAGFTPSVKERAKVEGIFTFTYNELFASFERVQPYLSYILGNSPQAKELKALDAVYEEPNFQDKHGNEWATEYLADWLKDDAQDRSWLIIVGEYGTGKTALTEVLQKRWAELYKLGRSPRIPFRIELRDFAKQFDSRGLLHHFLDKNELSHLPVSFVESMISNGRVVLLLDGYDEMAQYLNVRERRACLEALADLARNGAKGILTSRPNYFTEAEELRVFEVLYQKIASHQQVNILDRAVVEQEREVDSLLERFVLNRVERSLRDLTYQQTIDLVRRRLQDDTEGAEVVTGLLSKVFRNNEDGAVSLSGKPVIITYLLEVVEELKRDEQSDLDQRMSEWDIYNLIINKLMLRDWARTSTLLPTERYQFLQQLSLYTSHSQRKMVNESSFREVVRSVFESKIVRQKAEGGLDAEDAFFDDLRSSTTLTRCSDQGIAQWQFSHNSLREFLLAGYLVDRLIEGRPEAKSVSITDTVLAFTNSMPRTKLEEAYTQLSALWPSRKTRAGLDQMLALLWNAKRHNERRTQKVRETLHSLVGSRPDLSNCTLTGIDFSLGDEASDLRGLNMRGSILTDSIFTNADLSGADFSDCALDACSLQNANISEANFSNLLMLDTEITGLRCNGAIFTNLDKDSTAIAKMGKDVLVLDSSRIRGYLRRRGAKTDPVDPYYMYCFDKNFEICEKICKVLLDGAPHQRYGLEQRGASERNIKLAKSFVQFLISIGYVQLNNGRGGRVVSTTPNGRPIVARLSENAHIDQTLLPFFVENFH